MANLDALFDQVAHGLDPDQLPPRVQKDPAFLARLETLGLASLPTAARTLEVCRRCLEAGKGVMHDVPCKILRTPQGEELIALSAKLGRGVPYSLSTKFSDDTVRLCLRADPTVSLHDFKGERALALEAFRFDECGGLWSKLPHKLHTLERARRAWLENRVGHTLTMFPLEAIPDSAIAARLEAMIASKNKDRLVDECPRYTRGMWEKVIEHELHSLEIVPAELVTEAVALRSILNGTSCLDDIPAKVRTPAVVAAVDRRVASEKEERAKARPKNIALKMSVWLRNHPGATLEAKAAALEEATASEDDFEAKIQALSRSTLALGRVFRFPRFHIYTGPGVPDYSDWRLPAGTPDTVAPKPSKPRAPAKTVSVEPIPSVAEPTPSAPAKIGRVTKAGAKVVKEPAAPRRSARTVKA